MIDGTGSLKKPEDAGKGSKGVVARWLLELEMADKREKEWRKQSEEIDKRYRNGEKNKKDTNYFNILWSNTEILRPSLYNTTPKPDIRRRYYDPDPLGKQIAEVMERAVAFFMEEGDIDAVMDDVVLDYLLPGRAVTRVKFKPVIQKMMSPPTLDEMGQEIAPSQEYEKMVSAEVAAELVEWGDFRIGPGKRWGQVPWVAYRHTPTLEEAKANFPDLASKLIADVEIQGAPDREEQKKYGDEMAEVFQRFLIWEIWDKEKRQIIWIAPSYKDAPLKTEEDKLKLKDFFDCPKPLYAVKTSTSLVPVPEFELYRNQALELDRITFRINRLIRGLKLRGIYDAALKEMGQIMAADDNELMPSEGAALAIKQAGGLDKLIWMLPIEQAAKVLAQLYTQREQIKQTIYEITGLSDILRGASDPNETLGAQQLKAQTGSLRLQRRQRDVQRYIRDIVRIQAEIIAEHFTPELLSMMTGKQVTPEMMEIMRQDGQRGFRIGIETDSTIAANQQQDQESIVSLLEGVTGFVTAIGPAVQMGAVSMEAAKAMLLSSVRRFKLGREVEDALDQESANPSQPQQQGPSPEQMQAEKEQKDAEMKQRADEAKMMAQTESERSKALVESEKARVQAAVDQQKLADQKDLEVRKLQSAEKMKVIEIASNIYLEMHRQSMDAESVIREGEKAKAKEGADINQATYMAEGIKQLVESLSQSNQINTQTLVAAVQALSAPKRSELVRDSQGRAVAAVTQTMQ